MVVNSPKGQMICEDSPEGSSTRETERAGVHSQLTIKVALTRNEGRAS